MAFWLLAVISTRQRKSRPIATAVAAMKAGAIDYLSKPADADMVEAALLERGMACRRHLGGCRSYQAAALRRRARPENGLPAALAGAAIGASTAVP